MKIKIMTKMITITTLILFAGWCALEDEPRGTNTMTTTQQYSSN